MFLYFLRPIDIFFLRQFPALRSEQPAPADVPGGQAEPPQDPEPRPQQHRDHGGPQGAEAADLAQPGLQQHQGHRKPQPEPAPRAPGPLGQRHPVHNGHLIPEKLEGKNPRIKF